VPVGYYTTVHGLGDMPGDVTFTGRDGVHEAQSGDNLIKFWRGAENLANRPASGRMVWSVSQAAPLRRMIVGGDLTLGTLADTQGSGGYVSNLQISGKLNFTKQQQWIVRNGELGNGVSYFEAPPRAVNFIFVGTTGAPPATTTCTDALTNPASPSPQKLVEPSTPVSIEKPYLTITKDGRYNLVTPRAQYGSHGVQWGVELADVDGFESVFVATNATAVSQINAKLAAGKHVVLTPGVYSLPSPIRIGWTAPAAPTHQVLLGLGVATLIPTHGGAAIEVGDAPGVRVAGLLLQAGTTTSPALITIGTSPSAGLPSNPTSINDVFARVGGPGHDAVSAVTMMEVNGSHVVLDNVWLWRADILQNAGGRTRDVRHGLVVNGHNVTAYGLASEHMQSDNTVWNGEGGHVYFYQAELDGLAHTPNDATPDYGPNGVSGYRVNAKSHHAMGVGVYCWFSNPGILVQSAVKVLHKETVDGIVCPFGWTWQNPNTPPLGNSTILSSIQLV